MTQQMELRFDKDALLDSVQLSASVKAVLLRIGRYPECWEMQSTIARACGFRCVRTVQRAITELTNRDLVTTDRRWNARAGRVLNHHRVNWEEMRRLVGDQSDIESRPKRHPVSTKATLSHDQSDIESPITNKELTKEPTTNSDVVELVFSAGVKRAKQAVDAARAAGLDDGAIRERYQRWAELPQQSRLPGVLFNWLALRGSFESAFHASGPRKERWQMRGDATSKAENYRFSIRTRIIRDGRSNGVSEDEIDRQLAAAGVA